MIVIRPVQWLDAIAQRLLRTSERHPFLGPVLLGLALWALLQGVLWIGFGSIPHTPAAVLGAETVLLLAGASIPLLLVIVAFYSAFVEVARISQSARSPGRVFDLVRDYLATSLSAMKEQLQCLQGEGLSIAIADIDAHPESARQLQEIHDKLGADLLCLDEKKVEDLAEKHKLSASVVNLALWEEDFCLLWERGKKRFMVRLALVDGPNYPKVCDFVREVEAEAKPLRSLLPSHEQVVLTKVD